MGLTIEENPTYFKQRYQSRIDKKLGKGQYRLLGKFIGAKKQHKFKHNCGMKFFGNPQSLLFGYTKCPCQNKHFNKRTLKYHRNIIKKIRPDFDCLYYYGKRDGGASTYIHKLCNKTFQCSAASFLVTSTCPHCDGKFGANLHRLSNKIIQKRINKIYPGEYKIIEKYKHSQRKIIVRHLCGYKYKTIAYNLTKQDRGGQCPICYPYNLAKIKIIHINDKKFKCQGYEPLTLKRLIKKYNPKHIKTSWSKNRLIIQYKHKKAGRRYIPDFYIKSANLIIEVKSIATMGLQPKMYQGYFGMNLFERNQAKARACLRQGYQFRMHLYGPDKRRIKLPRNWMFLPKIDVVKQLGIIA
jgi:hypothetical protein